MKVQETLYNIHELEYELAHVIWKITLACNFKCKHCGFSAGAKEEDELSTIEALDLCDQLISLNAQNVALSGGEPLLRKDWPLISKKLSESGCKVIICTNGFLVNRDTFEQFKRAGVFSISLSLDGNEEVHDFIRNKGSFQKVINTIKLANELEFKCGVISTVNRKNMNQLDTIYKILVESGAKSWQVQLADQVGNMTENHDLALSIDDIEQIVKKITEIKSKSNAIHINVGDNLGYFTEEDKVLRQDFYGGCYTGCFAGIYVLGIESNGDIKGCPALPKQFIEGNIRKNSLSQIWNNAVGFSYNRQFKIENLSGYCRICEHNLICRGGCTTSRVGLKGDLRENLLCLKRIREAKTQSIIS